MTREYFDFTNRLFAPQDIEKKREALKGLRVLDLSHMIFGPTAAKALGQFGAEVIKVEVPYQGDYWRIGTYWGKYWKHSNPLWHYINHSKYFVGIDVKKPKGKDLILRLAEKADVVVENFTSGTVEAWGIGYSQVSKINPKVIYTSLSTYGQFGPYRYYPGWDLLAQGASGVLAATGHPDTDKYFKVPDFFGDFFPGYFAAMLIMIALNYRERTGEGQYIDGCQSEILMRSLFHFTYHEATGKELERTGSADPGLSPSGIFKTSDGKFLALAIATDKQFRSLCTAMERDDLADDERYQKAASRLQPDHAAALNKITEEWVRKNDLAAILSAAQQCMFAAAEVLDDVQISNDPWRRQRGSVIDYNDEMYKKLPIQGPIATLSKTPGRTKWLTRPLGYHNRYVLKKILGLSENQIKELEQERVVGNWDYQVGQRPPTYHDITKDEIFNYKGGEDH